MWSVLRWTALILTRCPPVLRDCDSKNAADRIIQEVNAQFATTYEMSQEFIPER